MFNFVCKSSLFVRHLRHTTLRASPTHQCHSLLLSVRFISTTATTNEQSLTVSYLINTCGFSPESALSVSNKFKLKSPNKADAAISFFKSHGFSQTHISNIIKKYPVVLLHDPEKTLLPKLEFLYSKGFSSHDLANIVSKYLQVLRRSLENHIIPNFNYLSNLFESQESTIATIIRRPYLLYHDLQTYMAPKVNILLEYGVPKYNIFMYMSPWSYSLRTDGKVFKEVVEEVKEMGINPLRTRFVKAVSIKGELSRSQWECKVNMYKRWGWSGEECLEAFRKHPQFMKHSEDKIMAAMDFFVNKMGLECSYIAKRPILVDYSLPKKVIPRTAVLQFLLSKGLVKSKHINLVKLFNYSEKAFLEKFVNYYDEAPQQLKLYKADTVISFFKSHGFSQTHISNIIKKIPRVLLYDPEKTLLPKLEFLYSKGFSSHDLANIFFKYPQVLRRSLENHIIPNFNYLSNLFESHESTIATIIRRPYLLYHDLQTYMAPKVNILLEYGVPKYNIFMYMSPWSYSLRTDGKVFKEVVEEVKEMGINPSRTQFVKAVSIKGELSRSQWECKVNMYKRWGWSGEECLEAFRKHPQFMKHSEDKIMAAMDFFVNKMGLEFSYIAKRPIFVDYSLPKKVIPRAAVFQFLLSKGLIKSKHTDLVELFNYSEKAFLEKFVNSYDEAPQLMKLYKEKLNLSKIT